MTLKEVFKAVGLLISKPYLLNSVLQNEDRFKIQVQKNYGILNGLPEIKFDQIANFDLSANPYAFLDGGSLPTDLILLNSLSQNKENYFEIGTWRGESVANAAKYAKQCFTLNQPEEEVFVLQDGELLCKQLRFYSKDLENVTHLFGNSFDFDFSPFHKKMDVVFIDGDHTYTGVLNDTKKAYSLLKDDDSVIVWHDYAHNPGKTRWEVLKAILDGIPLNEHKNIYSVTNTKCAIYTKKQYPSSLPNNISTPKIDFEIVVKTRA